MTVHNNTDYSLDTINNIYFQYMFITDSQLKHLIYSKIEK